MSQVLLQNVLKKFIYGHLLNKRNKLLKRIEINPNIMDGIPVIKGTRIPVYVILELFSAGLTAQKIIKEYPRLSLNDIRATLYLASLLSAMH